MYFINLVHYNFIIVLLLLPKIAFFLRLSIAKKTNILTTNC